MKTCKILLACTLTKHAHACPYNQPALWKAPSPPFFFFKVLSTSEVQQISDPLGCDGFSVPCFTSNLKCLRACLSLVFTQDCFFFRQEIPDRLWHKRQIKLHQPCWSFSKALGETGPTFYLGRQQLQRLWIGQPATPLFTNGAECQPS